MSGQHLLSKACARLAKAISAAGINRSPSAIRDAICARWPLDQAQTERWARLALGGQAGLLDPRAPQWRAAAALACMSVADLMSPLPAFMVAALPPEVEPATTEDHQPRRKTPKPKAVPVHPGDSHHAWRRPDKPRRRADILADRLCAIMSERGISSAQLTEMIEAAAPGRSRCAYSVGVTEARTGKKDRSWVWPAIASALKVSMSALLRDPAWASACREQARERKINTTANVPPHLRAHLVAQTVVARRAIKALMDERGMMAKDIVAVIMEDHALAWTPSLSASTRRATSTHWPSVARALGVALSALSPCPIWQAVAGGALDTRSGRDHIYHCASIASDTIDRLMSERGMSASCIIDRICAADPLLRPRTAAVDMRKATQRKRINGISPAWPIVARALGVMVQDLCNDPVWCALQPRYEDIS